MANNTETGHVVNANNLIEKINVINRHQAEYKPTNVSISLKTLLPLQDLVRKAVEGVSVAKIAFTDAVDSRRKNYIEMDDRATRSIQILKSSDATAEQIKQGKALLAKYKSERVGDVTTPKEASAKAVDGETPKVPKTISVSHQGFANKLSHFREIVQLLKSVASYKPVEPELTVDGLTSFANMVDKLNNERNKLADNLAVAIAARDKIMYSEDSGAYAVSNKILAYVAGASSKESPFYKELAKYPVRIKK